MTELDSALCDAIDSALKIAHADLNHTCLQIGPARSLPDQIARMNSLASTIESLVNARTALRNSTPENEAPITPSLTGVPCSVCGTLLPPFGYHNAPCGAACAGFGTVVPGLPVHTERSCTSNGCHGGKLSEGDACPACGTPLPAGGYHNAPCGAACSGFGYFGGSKAVHAEYFCVTPGCKGGAR